MLKTITKYEIKRYKKKGAFILIGFAILFLFFVYFPTFAIRFVPFVLNNFSDDTYFLVILHNSCYITLSFALYICHHFDLFRYYKTNSYPWPWESNLKEWNELFKKSIQLLFLNMFIIGPIIVIATKDFVKLNYKTDEASLPHPLNFTAQILICFFANDFLFHFSHKLLHQPFFFKWIHSVHHQYSHVIGISSEYAHPIEMIFGNSLPAAAGPIILHYLNFPNFHIVTLWGFAISGVGAVIEQHSAYDFPFSPYGIVPFTFGTSYHDYHHTRAKHNYSSNFIYLDLIFGNNYEYYSVMESREESKNKNT